MSQDNEDDGPVQQQINHDQDINNIDGMRRQYLTDATAATTFRANIPAAQQPQQITSSTNNDISTTTNTNDTSTTTRRRRPPPRRVDHTYREYSKFPMNELPSGKKDNNFPAKVHRILSLPEYASIISWMPHGRAWKIHDKDKLVRQVIPNFFGQSKYESFTRQLNGWGYKRLYQSGNDCNAYYHECFLRGLPHLTSLMKRVQPNQGKLLPHVEGEPNFYEIEKQYPFPDPNQALSMHSFIPQGWGQEGVAASVPQAQETSASAADHTGDNFQANHYPPHPPPSHAGMLYGYGLPPPQYYPQAQQGQESQEAQPFPPPYYHPSSQLPQYGYQPPHHGQQQYPLQASSSDPLQSGKSEEPVPLAPMSSSAATSVSNNSLSVPHDVVGDQFQPIKFDDYGLSEKSTSEAATNTETESSSDK